MIATILKEQPDAMTKDIRPKLEEANWHGGKPPTDSHFSYVVTGIRRTLGIQGASRVSRAKSRKPEAQKAAPPVKQVARVSLPEPASSVVKFCPCCGTNIENIAMAIRIAGQSGR